MQEESIILEEGIPKPVSMSTDNEGQVIQTIFDSFDENGSFMA